MQEMKLSSILHNSVKALTPEHTLNDAFISMKENSISSVVVINENNEPLGIFTEYDALKLITRDKHKTKLGDIMTKHLFTVTEDMYLHDAYIMMEQKGFRHLVITDQAGYYQGVVTEGDFLRHLGFEELTQLQRVSDAMNDALLIISPDTPIIETAQLMSEKRCDYAIIMQNGVALGLVRERDITHYCATELLHEEHSVSVIEKHEISYVKRDTSLQEAAKLMEHHGVHQLLVMSEDEELIGLITRHDILKNIHSAYFDLLLNTIEKKNLNERELHKRTKQLQEQTLLLNNVLNTIPDLIWLKDAQGVYLACNNKFEAFYGASQEEIVGKSDYDFINKDQADFFRTNDQKAMLENGYSQNDEYLVFADGSHEGFYDTLKTPLKDDEGNILGTLGIATDVSKRKERELELEKLANYDTLTGLPNRSFLKAYLEKSIAKALRSDTEMALILFDLDRFKDINDSYGHSIGDELLLEVSNRFTSRLRRGDMVARLGGDEFAVILEHITSEEDVQKLIEEIMSSLANVYHLSSGLEVHIASSAGIVIAPKDGDTPEELLQHADSALYKAKSNGRGIFTYYTNEMTEHSQTKVSLENDLRNALANDEFELYYQPQVHLHTNKIVGVEALIRWNHPQKGLIMPDIFIPVAEETGLINPLGEWVLNAACEQGKRWLDSGHRLTVSVNVSANQVRYQNLPELVKKTLQKHQYDPTKLEIEFTESALMNREQEVVEMLHSLRALGIRLAIDDFGTGYSSLSYLKKFPIDILKIDKSFIDDIPYESDDMAIVIAIIEMGKALGYQIIAEGTEHSAQVDFLREKGCTMYQGYFKSKPLPVNELKKLLEED